MDKKTVNSKALYKDFNKVVTSYKMLNPEKYSSLEMICYADFMEERLIPYVKDLNETQGLLLDEDLIIKNAHALWLAAYENEIIDQFCQPTGKNYVGKGEV